MNKPLRIVYLGTPDFAVESLDILMRNNYNVVGVVTMPDKPAGRGHKLQHSPVKKYALENDIPLLQPTNLKSESFIDELATLKADLQVVVAFRMLPKAVWDMPSLGTINVHASLLPQYRGAAPINWAVMNGDKKTGVSTFRLKHEIDTGGILLQKSIDIDQEDNAGAIHDKLMYLGAEALLETIQGLEKGELQETPQEQLVDTSTELKKAPKIFKQDCHINWSSNVEDLYNKIRGLSPYPTAFCKIKEENKAAIVLKIFSATILHNTSQLKPGELQVDKTTSSFVIGCNDGALQVNELQLAGKKRMKTEDFLRGFNTNVNYTIE